MKKKSIGLLKVTSKIDGSAHPSLDLMPYYVLTRPKTSGDVVAEDTARWRCHVLTKVIIQSS